MKPPSSTANPAGMNRPARRLWVRFVKALVVLFLAVVAVVAGTIAIARASLPATCAVAEAQFDKLSMEMSYDAAKKLLGCDGALVVKEDYGQIVIEHFEWRGATWPYGRLRLQFINSTLQGTEKLWFNLSVSMSK